MSSTYYQVKVQLKQSQSKDITKVRLQRKVNNYRKSSKMTHKNLDKFHLNHNQQHNLSAVTTQNSSYSKCYFLE